LKRTKAEQKKFQSPKHKDVKPAVFQSDEEVDTNFDSDSDYIESEHAPEKEEIQGKYAFLQNHPLYETHQVNISKSKIWCLILQEDHCLDVTEVIESITVLQC